MFVPINHIIVLVVSKDKNNSQVCCLYQNIPFFFFFRLTIDITEDLGVDSDSDVDYEPSFRITLG